ncbi:MAG TPA: arylsulfotransferase family protein [Thermoanaerobaculia bacterium]
MRQVAVLAALAALAACRVPDVPSSSSGSSSDRAPAASPAVRPETAAADGPAQGKWHDARGGAAAGPQASEAAGDVKALPYLQGYRPAQDHPVVIEHDPAATFQGLNLYVSGHAAEAVLMDMHGRTLHRWRYPLRRLWPDLARDPEMAKLEYWRRAYLYPNGDLLAIYEGQGLVKLDARSRVLWAHRGGIHHDLFVAGDGTIYALDREGKVIPWIHRRKGVLEDFVAVLDASGRLLRKVSILEAFARSPYASLLQGMRHSGDVFHTNTLEVLDGRFADRHPAFRKGNVLVSVWRLDTIAVLDLERQTVAWALTGGWHRQHQPTFLDNGRLLLFDNLGAAWDRSRVLEIDPLTGRTLWQFGGGRDVDLFSKTLGSCQRLPNGNTLITESENGRALEVTRDGRTVWEFYNPHRAGERNELVAALFEVVRLPPDFRFHGSFHG